MALTPPTRDLGALLRQQLDKATDAASRVTQAAKDAAAQEPAASTPPPPTTGAQNGSTPPKA